MSSKRSRLRRSRGEREKEDEKEKEKKRNIVKGCRKGAEVAVSTTIYIFILFTQEMPKIDSTCRVHRRVAVEEPTRKEPASECRGGERGGGRRRGGRKEDEQTRTNCITAGTVVHRVVHIV